MGRSGWSRDSDTLVLTPVEPAARSQVLTSRRISCFLRTQHRLGCMQLLSSALDAQADPSSFGEPHYHASKKIRPGHFKFLTGALRSVNCTRVPRALVLFKFVRVVPGLNPLPPTLTSTSKHSSELARDSRFLGTAPMG